MASGSSGWRMTETGGRKIVCELTDDLDFDGLKAMFSKARPANVRPVVRGKWTLHDDGSGTCSECGIRQMLVWDDDNWMNYCGNCGACMEGES